MPEVLPDDARRRQLGKVLSSNTFRTCGSLCRLLEYLSERVLAGDAQDLKEYRIGVEGLGKEESYDPRTDASVRVQVGRLRSRLAEYYIEEGRDDPIVITVPKGAFSVVFAERKPADGPLERPPDRSIAPPPVEPPADLLRDAETKRESRFPRRSVAMAGAAAAVLCIVAILVFWSRTTAANSASHPEDEAFRALWHPYFSSTRPTLISLGIPLWLRFETQTPDGTTLVGTLRDGQLNEWPADSESVDGKRVAAWKKQLRVDQVEPRHHYVAVGEAIGAFLLGKALAGHLANATLVRSNMLSWDSAKAANVIFIGAPKFNPHLRNVPFSRNFKIGDFFVYNLNPKPGELEAYPDEPKTTDLRGAALIGRYRSPGGGGWFTLVGSANSMCTWAAIEYLTRPEYVANLTNALRRAFGKIPDSFEVVIEARFDQSNPIEVHHVALREVSEPRVAAAR
ncbi:MAG: hypothetical protein ACRD7E_04250 [Bryobacteraceae bacterium]